MLWFQEQSQIFGLALPSTFGEKQGQSELKIKMLTSPHFHLCFQKELVLWSVDNAKYGVIGKYPYAFEEWKTPYHAENPRPQFLSL